MEDFLQRFQANRAESAARLWFDAPGSVHGPEWESSCLPLGNGHAGAMLAGQPALEEIQLNEKTLWSGGPGPLRPHYNGGNIPGRHTALQRVQELLLAGKSEEAAALAERDLLGETEGYGAYQNFGWLRLRHSIEGTPPTGYVRDLALDTATATVSFAQGGVAYVREYFFSYPARVLAVRVTASQASSISLAAGLQPDRQGYETLQEDNTLLVQGALQDNGLRYTGGVTLLHQGGTARVRQGEIHLQNADSAVLLVALGTDYAPVYPHYRSGLNPLGLVRQTLQTARALGWRALYEQHLQDYRALYGRVSLSLGGGPAGRQAATEEPGKQGAAPADAAHPASPPLAAVAPGPTTPQLLRQYRAGQKSPALQALLFQYGRYLTIASSRPGSLPANLQGVWNNSNTPIWGCDYHLNVNLQMNYWPAHTTNLTECALPLLDFVESLREPGRVTAAAYAGIKSTPQSPQNGFMVHTQVTPFGWTCPGWQFSWGWSPAAGAWILHNLYEHYRFTGDVDLLRSRIYPLMREQCRFWQQYLVQNPADGLYYSAPAFSPEHGPYTLGNTYEHVLVRALLQNTMEAAALLGVDEALRRELAALHGRLRGEEIGADGQVKEWFAERHLHDMEAVRCQNPYQRRHRHLSHLLGVYPGESISAKTPALQQAARVSLRDRGASGPTITGWAAGQRLLAWARLGGGEKCSEVMDGLFANCILDNLLDTHPPFQIDGNLAFTAAVAEMLLQSHEGYLHLLPALPPEWDSGEVHGLVARGGFVVDMAWEGHTLAWATITARRQGVLRVKDGPEKWMERDEAVTIGTKSE